MIRLEGVEKYYVTHWGRHYVFRSVSLTIPDGMKVGVIGPNGAGKTTLLRLLSGVDVPSRGRITRSGRISWPLGLTAGTQKTMTGAQNARFVGRVQGITGAAADRIVEFAREFSELGDFFDMPVSTYSSGMRSRLNFAIAMCFDFDTYIIDELTATGDKNFKQKSREFFTNKRRVAGLVKVSHDAGELREECEAGIVLGGGELRFYDDIAEAFSFYEAQGYAPLKTVDVAAIARGVGTPDEIDQVRADEADAEIFDVPSAPLQTVGLRGEEGSNQAGDNLDRRNERAARRERRQKSVVTGDGEGSTPPADRTDRRNERAARRERRQNAVVHWAAMKAPLQAADRPDRRNERAARRERRQNAVVIGGDEGSAQAADRPDRAARRERRSERKAARNQDNGRSAHPPMEDADRIQPANGGADMKPQSGNTAQFAKNGWKPRPDGESWSDRSYPRANPWPADGVRHLDSIGAIVPSPNRQNPGSGPDAGAVRTAATLPARANVFQSAFRSVGLIEPPGHVHFLASRQRGTSVTSRNEDTARRPHEPAPMAPRRPSRPNR